jgi:hypothetical protein
MSSSRTRPRRGRSPAASSIFGEGRPVGGAVFLNDLDLAAQHAAHRVDLFDGEALGLDRAGFGNRHRARGRVKLADRHRGVRDREARGVDLRRGRRLRKRAARQAQRHQRRGGETAEHFPAQRRRHPGIVIESIVCGHHILLIGCPARVAAGWVEVGRNVGSQFEDRNTSIDVFPVRGLECNLHCRGDPERRGPPLCRSRPARAAFAPFRIIDMSQSHPSVGAPGTQRIVKVRRDYNAWVADETLEDYALRFTPRSFRRWSELRVANTAIGAVSFLVLEAIGGSLVVNYGFTNAVWAIAAVSVLIWLTSLPISYYAARYGVDMDLLTRGAGFGYIGSTVTSLIYAVFTFIFSRSKRPSWRSRSSCISIFRWRSPTS